MEIKKAGHIFGEVIGETYYTQRKPQHFMKMYQGFGISEWILGQLKNMNVKWIVFEYETINNRIIKYRCTLSKYLASNKEYAYQDPYNRFGGEEDIQKFVSMKDYDIYIMEQWNGQNSSLKREEKQKKLC